MHDVYGKNILLNLLKLKSVMLQAYNQVAVQVYSYWTQDTISDNS